MIIERSAGQKLIQMRVGDEFVAKVDAAMAKTGHGNRSQFIRDAVLEKLRRTGRDLDAVLARAPSRLGKGRPRRA